MIASTLAGLVVLLSVDFARPGGLTVIWIITGGWIALRTAFGLLRIWPGFGASPLRSDSAGLDLTSPDQKL
jgi:hypothetical protein